MRGAVIIAAVLSAALLSCSKPENESPAAMVAVTPGAVAQPGFEIATRDFHEALRNDNTDGMMEHVAEDVVMMPPGEGAVRGKTAMREWHGTFLSLYRTKSLKLDNREIFVGNGLAVEISTYAWGLQPVAGGETFIDYGNYMQVWKQQPSGQWLFAREIWNGSVPAQSTPGAS